MKSENGRDIIKKILMKLPRKNQNEIFEIINKYYNNNLPDFFIENIIINE